MNLLLDTCAILFLSSNAPQLKDSTLEWVKRADEIFVSAVSVGEIACLVNRKRVDLGGHWKPWFREAVMKNGWNVLAITQEVMEESYSLPDTFHSDPADRMIVATARLHKFTVLTTDSKILQYPHVDAEW